MIVSRRHESLRSCPFARGSSIYPPFNYLRKLPQCVVHTVLLLP